ncbi:LTV-domain-containing protein [Russula earlei]|uniref:LTV-domain-containing protein n=1 Tax=Russula earlei TaxID=71964 RepID=A0ACC0UJ93_9AGAM|nr:LTV-domain-containing protein [Russula earlei]
MPSKSIFRRPGAQHFQLVHRSQRDPLINDPDASQHVLKPIVRENTKKGKSRVDLETLLPPSDLASRPNIGEASLYGVYFDDTEYDYMQHLRPVGGREEGFESILVETQKKRSSSKKTSDLPISLHDLPPEALPSVSELPRDFESQAAVQSSISGLQPNMDFHLRQTLEALEDDAYVDDDLDDDFFGELIKEGERDAAERLEYEFREDDPPTDGTDADGAHERDGGGEAWLASFAAFKRDQQSRKPTDTSSSDVQSEADTVGHMPEFSATDTRRGRRETSDASGFSMSSASIFRSEGLRDLDERFDQIEKEYIDDEGNEHGPRGSDDSDSAPELITSREDFESLMDDFLQNYEVSGGKMKPSLPGSGPEKLESLRIAMGRVEPMMVEDSDQDENEDDDFYAVIEENRRRERWDVETVLTTYTNLENHPRLIKAREERRVSKIRLDPETGLPFVESNFTPRSDISQSLPGRKAAASHVTTRRPQEESTGERRERKRAVKAERRARRVEKKDKKELFSSALKQHSQALAQKDAQIRKL